MRKFIKYASTKSFSPGKNIVNLAAISNRCCILDSNRWKGHFELIVAIDCIDEIIPKPPAFDILREFYEEKKDWIFGFFSYDLKNEIESLSSKNEDGIGFPQMHFFQPKYIILITDSNIEIGFIPEVCSEKEVNELYAKIVDELHSSSDLCHSSPLIKIDCRVSKDEYIKAVKNIQKQIRRGDIYEMNYCIEFFSENANINPGETFKNLNRSSSAPFSAYYRLDDKYLMCSSPERFLKKTGDKINSQPIKGTAKRGKTREEDLAIKENLQRSTKDKSENVMIVDLVRNDLSKTCNHVHVEELFAVYSFEKWHQMISSISGKIKNNIHAVDVIKNSFPMGSMTGAPKLNAMKLIEKYEKTKRGLFSGSVGYFKPGKSEAGEAGPVSDFDFNVVIRSILYNASKKYLSFQVGSAITANSIPEEEYYECLLKGEGMFEALSIPKLKEKEAVQHA